MSNYFVGIGIKLLPYEKWYKIIHSPQCSCVSTQNIQRLSQQILMQLNSIKVEMWCDITKQWMAQFLKVRVQTDIRARRRVKERQYGHSQHANSTAHTTKKSMSSLIPDLNETITSVGTWKEKYKSNHPPTATVIQNEKYANVSVLRINFRRKKFVFCFFFCTAMHVVISSVS